MAIEHSHAGHRSRLKQRFLQEGLDSFEPHEILELLLFYAIPVQDTNELAHMLLRTFGSLSGVFDADPKELEKVAGIKEHSAILLSMIPQLSRAYVRDRMSDRPILSDTKRAGSYVSCLFMGRLYEVFYVISLDNSGRILHEDKICEGTLDETACYPRLVMETAFRHHAQKIILAHNHPSGVLRPSDFDIRSTELLCRTLDAVGIGVVDHIIAGKNDFFSMRAAGLMPRLSPNDTY